MKIMLLSIALLLVSCGGSVTAPVTPAPPNSPQTLALNIDKTLADAINAAVKTAIALRDQGKVSQTDTMLIEIWAKSAATTDDIIATELGSADTWAVQKGKILTLLPLFKVPGTSTADLTLQASLSAVVTLVTQLQTQVNQ